MFIVFKIQDLEQYSTQWYTQMLNALRRRLARKREVSGKRPTNEYIVINTDEPFIEEVKAVMRRFRVNI
jgi:hypothetical protein